MPTVISTFAGCGGSSLGYKWAGYDELLAVEWDKHAAETFKANFPEVPLYLGDIAKLSVGQVLERTGLAPGELDVFDGSPPCQGFSSAGRRKMLDPRNSLFEEYVRLLQGLQPRVFVMENVSGMVKGKMKFIFVEILQALKQAGYKVRAQVLDAKYFGVPQNRKRMIFIGCREDLAIDPSFPAPKTRPIPLKIALNDCPEGLNQGDFTGERLELARKIKPWESGTLSGKRVRDFNLQRNDWDKPSRSITAMVGGLSSCFGPGIIHPDQHRHHTIGEVKRIMSFPDDFRLEGTFEEQWKRMGNSVAPRFMESISRHIRENMLDMAPVSGSLAVA
tara:strand:+ start:1071 stop:2069 length:999 start_codon:yes stop_codon:yes gene_type:complete